MIDRSPGTEILLDWKTRNEATDLSNGTAVVISNVLLPRLNTSSVVDYIERHLQAFRALGPQVAVNDHLCEYREPAVAEQFEFLSPGGSSDWVGGATLIIKVAQAPLPEPDQGVTVTAGMGNLVAIEKAGIERKEFGSYLFGTVDVPALETFQTPLEPYDSSRTLTLNPSHPVAAATISFIGAKLEEVRLKLVGREREARKTEQAKRLSKEAERIAEILNHDFESVRQRLHDIRSASSTKGPVASAFGGSDSAGEDNDQWVEGIQAPGNIPKNTTAKLGSGGTGRQPPKVATSGTPDPQGTTALDPAGGIGERRPKPRGGFRVDYRNLGKDELRSVYDPGALIILINLDHPVVSAALGDGKVEDPIFRRLSYEIAFSEYSMALGYEMAKQDPDIPADDLLYEVRACLNRISVAAASLYR